MPEMGGLVAPPADWREVAFADVAEVVGGGTPSTKVPENFDGEIPWLTPKDLSGTHERYIDRGERSLSQRGLDSSSAKLLPKGSVLLSTRAPIGYVALAKNPIATSQGFRSLAVRAGAVPEYLYYWLKLNTEELERHASGSTFRELSGSSLKEIRLRLPPLEDQSAIARVLGALDDKIELNRRMNATLDEMARALFWSWFVDFNPIRAKVEGRWHPGQSLPGLPANLYDLFPDRLVPSELGEIPEGWQVARLSSMIDVNPTRLLRKGDVAPYLDMANMPTRGHSPDTVIERPFGSGMRFLNGDTLVARITPCLENGKSAYVDFLRDGQTGWGSTEYIVLRPKAPIPEEIAYCLARSSEFREFAIRSMTGSSGRQRVPATAISDFPLVSSPIQIAEQFGQLVKPLFAAARAATAEARTLAELRDVLLPKLIAGEIRVRESARELEAAM